jgi:pantothenate kinase
MHVMHEPISEGGAFMHVMVEPISDRGVFMHVMRKLISDQGAFNHVMHRYRCVACLTRITTGAGGVRWT